MNTPFHHDGLTFNLVTGATGTPVVFQHGLCGSAAQTMEAFPEDPGVRGEEVEEPGRAGNDECCDHRKPGDGHAQIARQQLLDQHRQADADQNPRH